VKRGGDLSICDVNRVSDVRSDVDRRKRRERRGEGRPSESGGGKSNGG
jgi:hypothetical protein